MDIIDLALTILSRINDARLGGPLLLLALLMSFFSGVAFTIRRLRMDARAFWTHILRPSAAQAEAPAPAAAALGAGFPDAKVRGPVALALFLMLAFGTAGAALAVGVYAERYDLAIVGVVTAATASSVLALALPRRAE